MDRIEVWADLRGRRGFARSLFFNRYLGRSDVVALIRETVLRFQHEVALKHHDDIPDRAIHVDLVSLIGREARGYDNVLATLFPPEREDQTVFMARKINQLLADQAREERRNASEQGAQDGHRGGLSGVQEVKQDQGGSVGSVGGGLEGRPDDQDADDHLRSL